MAQGHTLRKRWPGFEPTQDVSRGSVLFTAMLDSPVGVTCLMLASLFL